MIVTALLLVPTHAAEEYHWFFKPVKDARPTMPPDGVKDPGENALMIGPDAKRVYLTFDAGFINDNVRTITQILKEEEVPAAFFILKQVVNENADLIEEWREAGFLVCNHTFTHKNCARLSEEEMKRELLSLEELYREKTGGELAKFFRPPEGSYNQKVIDTAASLGYRTVFWSCAYADWDNDRQMAKADALKLLLSRTHNGALVLLHPTGNTNAAILRDYIRALKTAGYTFGSLEELS
ncbi:MAG: polysaccharide deacetylase family protein [Clostridia bacterium]|nr:polysaccharide deacetylase family protein [Clostridia bacterium]